MASPGTPASRARRCSAPTPPSSERRAATWRWGRAVWMSVSTSGARPTGRRGSRSRGSISAATPRPRLPPTASTSFSRSAARAGWSCSLAMASTTERASQQSVASARRCIAQLVGQPIEQGHLGGVDPNPRLVEVEPRDTIDLGDVDPVAGAGRPFERERVALRGRRVEITLRRPRGDVLARFLADLAERHEVAVRRPLTGLFLELPARDGRRILAGLDLAFRYGPRPGVAFLPQRAAGVCEQDFELIAGASVQEQAGASPHAWLSIWALWRRPLKST